MSEKRNYGQALKKLTWFRFSSTWDLFQKNLRRIIPDGPYRMMQSRDGLSQRAHMKKDA